MQFLDTRSFSHHLSPLYLLIISYAAHRALKTCRHVLENIVQLTQEDAFLGS
jgi:hypothetical protein